MKNISLFQGILYGVFGVGALIGLIVFATYTGGAGSGGIGTVVVWGTLPKDAMTSALTAITQQDTQLKGVTYVEKSADTLPGDLAAAIATGNAPDLVLASQEELVPLSKFLAPIPLSQLSASSYQSTFVDEANLFSDGSTGHYGVPFLVDPLVLYSNQTILSSSGIALAPASWDALAGLVSKVALLTPSRQVSRGLIGLGTYSNVHNARALLSAIFLQAGVPLSGVSTAGISANLGRTANGGEAPGVSVVRFYSQFADPAKMSYTWNASLPDSQSAFLNGTVALYAGFASEANYLRAANPNLNFAVSPLPQPLQSLNNGVKSTYGLVYAFMIPNGAKNASGAYQAAALLTGVTEQGLAANATGLAPSVRASLASTPNDPVAAVAYASTLYAKGWLSPAPAQTDQAFSAMMSAVMSGSLSVDDALTRAEQTLTANLAH